MNNKNPLPIDFVREEWLEEHKEFLSNHDLMEIFTNILNKGAKEFSSWFMLNDRFVEYVDEVMDFFVFCRYDE